jgi:NAD(P)-dependent dehydrogenase (short-subunit alcohol dehydrogenase family)
VTTVLVTGANSGIGAATTAALLEAGADVAATVRSGGAASRVHRAHRSDRLTVNLLDVTDPVACQRVIDDVQPDSVVNTAGDALLGAMVDADDEAVRAQFETLVIAPVRLARLAAVHQRGRGHGRVVNVSSSTAHSSLPFTGWYAAAKAALDAATDALRLELGPSGIDVVRVELGAVRTPAWDDAGDTVEAGDDPTSRHARHRWAVLTRLARPAFGDPDDVGDVIARAVLDAHPRRVYRCGFGARMGLLSALAPDAVEDAVKRRVFGLETPPDPA